MAKVTVVSDMSQEHQPVDVEVRHTRYRTLNFLSCAAVREPPDAAQRRASEIKEQMKLVADTHAGVGDKHVRFYAVTEEVDDVRGAVDVCVRYNTSADYGRTVRNLLHSS